MEENLEVVKYGIKVPYNNAVMVKARKKLKMFAGIMLMLCTLVFIGMAVMAYLGNNSSLVVVGVFAGGAVVALGCGLYFFLTIKPNAKDDGKVVLYSFYNDFLVVDQDDESKQKSRNLSRCLYRSYKNKQYVSKIIETNDMFEIKIYAGTYNGIPQYKKHFVPKELVGENQLEEFKTFLKQAVGKDYLIKQ